MKLLLILMLLAAPVLAQDQITLKWDPSISEPLDLGEGGGYRVYCDKQSVVKQLPVPSMKKCEVPEGPNTCIVDTTGWRGRNYCSATAWLVQNTEEFESDWSNEVSKAFKPHPPTLLQEVVNTATYPAKKVYEGVAWFFGKRKDLEIKEVSWQ